MDAGGIAGGVADDGHHGGIAGAGRAVGEIGMKQQVGAIRIFQTAPPQMLFGQRAGDRPGARQDEGDLAGGIFLLARLRGSPHRLGFGGGQPDQAGGVVEQGAPGEAGGMFQGFQRSAALPGVEVVKAAGILAGQRNHAGAGLPRPFALDVGEAQLAAFLATVGKELRHPTPGLFRQPARKLFQVVTAGRRRHVV